MAPAASSQTLTTGEITGSVLDPAGRLVIGANVQLKSTDTGESRAVLSGASGVYRFALVQPGTYEISGSTEALKSNTGRVTAAVAQVGVLDLHLAPEEVRSVVVVTDAATLLNKDNANSVYALSTRQLEFLPLAGEDLVGVAYTAPGVVVSSHNNGGAYGSFSSLGRGSVSNLITVNGTDEMDPYLNVNNAGTSGMLLGANEVREASVIQSAMEGQYGRQAGAQVTYVTKSGTNSYHGNLVYGYNGSRLNANDFFANASGIARPHAVANQYASSLGGRIVKDRLFFFADTEGLRFALPAALSPVATPSPALQSFALSTVQPSQVVLYQRMFDLYNSAPGHEHAVPVTTGNGPLQDSSGKLGCGRFTGTPTGAGGVFGTDVPCVQTWLIHTPSELSEWLFSTRLDYNIGKNQRIFVRFKTDQGSWPAYTSPISPAFDGVLTRPDYEGQVNHTFVITPHLVNSFIGSFTYNNNVYADADPAAALRAFPFRMNIRSDGGTNSTQISSMGAQPFYPQGRRASQYQIIEDVSFHSGRHTLKGGLNYRYNPETDLEFANFLNGVFNFYRVDEFVRGAISGANPSFFTQNFASSPVQHLRLYSLGAYFQEEWAVTPDLRMTAAIRMERAGNPSCTNHCFAGLIRPFPDLNQAASVPYNQSIRTGLSRAFYGVEPVVAQPRFSLAYSPAWSRGTVIRVGVGILSDQYPAFIANALGGNAPNVFNATVYTGLMNTGGPGSAPAIAAASATQFASQFASGATLTQLQQAVAPASFSAPGYYAMPSTVKMPKYLEWSLEIQHQLGSSSVMSVRYTGNHGYDIFLPNQNANASADPAFFPHGFAGLPASPPDPRFAAVWQGMENGYSNYGAFIAELRHALGHGIEGHVSYTWSHALDTLSNGGLLNFNYDSVRSDLRLLAYSNADYDVRHNVAGDLIWELPLRLKDRLLNAILGRWSLAAKLSAHTGAPFSVANLGLRGVSAPGLSVLADVVDPEIHRTCGRSAVTTPCFSAGEFAPAATQADLGNLPRNSFRGAGYFNFDAAVFKAFAVRERMRLTIGASAYNALNHPNFLDPNFAMPSPGLGLITGTALNPSGPYGSFGGPSGRALVVNGRFSF